MSEKPCTGVYCPWNMSLERYVKVYVAGPNDGYANGETAASVERYLRETIARLNRYYEVPDAPGPGEPSPQLPIRQSFIPPGNPNRPGTRIVPSWITIHETANRNVGANAEMHRRFTHQGGGPERVSFHYTVDDHEAIQLLPHDEMAWHAGDGCDNPATDTGCFRSIAIETCVNADGNWGRTKQHLVALVAHIIATDGRFHPDRIAQHWNWSRKNCPATIRAEGSWEQLMSEIRAEAA